MAYLLQVSLAVVLAFSAGLLIACSRGGGEASDVANSQAVPPFSEITDAQQALAIGNQLLENNETERAIDAFLRAVELDPDLAEAYFKLGIAYALIEKEQKIDAEPDANGFDNGSRKLPRTDSEKAFRKAIEAYKKILSANPDDHVAHYNLGRAYNKLNQDEEAARSLKQAVRIHPDDTEYQTELGAILIKLAQYREAIPPLKKALELDPENSRAAGLLEDAEAGRSRIDYVPPKKDEKGANSNSNSNINAATSTNSLTPVSGNSDKKPDARPTPVRRPANKPE